MLNDLSLILIEDNVAEILIVEMLSVKVEVMMR